eukprot:Phypoly_transcript_07846.p1 GENE.Phypoly_transcript_07846~~Phypoly_transcript_07846.p1  ORF type:complete len:479 (+),score=56.38 Phypoly_transcript_07846:141-1577(+)
MDELDEWRRRHPQLTTDFEIANAPKKGRLLLSKRERREGDLLLTSMPYTYALLDSHQRIRCALCLNDPDSLSRCSRCRGVYYCSTQCQRQAWPIHKHECDASLRVSPNVPTPTMRLLLHMLWKRKLESGGNKKQTNTNEILQTFEDVSFLKDHADENSERRVEFTPQAVITKQFLGETFDEIPINKIIDFLFLFSCNNFNISDGEMRPIGVGLYPLAALINHSCSPNSVAVFEGPRVYIRAIQNIKAGEEITVSYIEVGMTKQQRQATLAKHFYFVCECERCQNEANETNAYKCTNGKCPGAVYKRENTAEGICQTCGKTTSWEEITNLLHRANQLLEQAQALRKDASKDPRQSLDLYGKSTSIFRQVLHHLSPELMAHLDEAMSACIDSQAYPQAYEYCTLSLPIYERIYSPNWPLLGLQYYMKGKLANYLGHLSEAIGCFQKALKILRITHGMHPIVPALQRQLQETQAEVDHQSQ